MRAETGSRPTAATRLLTALLASGILTGCGGGGDLRVGQSGDLRSTAEVLDTTTLAQQFGSNVPLIFVDRLRSGGYTYRIQEQLYDERDLLALMRAVVANDPAFQVCVVPSAALTQDEIGLIEAKLRDAGVQNIRVSRTGG